MTMHDDDKNTPMFENAFQPSQNITDEFQNQLNLKTHSFFSYLFCALFLLLALWAFLAKEWPFFWFCLILSPVLPIIITIRKRAESKQMLKRWLLSGEYITHFFEDAFSYRDLTFQYSQISSVKDKTICIYIQVEKAFTVTVKKDSFTTGTYIRFNAFLRKKLAENPKALRSWH